MSMTRKIAKTPVIEHNTIYSSYILHCIEIRSSYHIVVHYFVSALILSSLVSLGSPFIVFDDSKSFRFDWNGRMYEVVFDGNPVNFFFSSLYYHRSDVCVNAHYIAIQIKMLH